jgi:hypothetical protein
LNKEEQFNVRLMAEFQYDLDHNNKPLKDRPSRPGNDLRRGMSRRYPELGDDYLASLKEYLPEAPLTQNQKETLSAMSSNTNVQRNDILTREELDELDLLK